MPKGFSGKEALIMATWKEVREDLNLSSEDENIIELEKDLIKAMVKAMVKAREEKGLSQAQLAELCHVKQPVIARLESSIHSPQINSLLKVLVPLGYKLQIVPITQKTK